MNGSKPFLFLFIALLLSSLTELEGADMIECCNIDCPNGRWFHQNCVMDVEDDGEWFCSPQCEQSNMGQFCICRQKGEEGTELKWTCANESCQRGTHFHSQCARSTLPVPQGKYTGAYSYLTFILVLIEIP